MIKRAGGALLLSIEIDRSAPGTVSHQLYSAMRDIIHAGGMHIGERLPASRTLARELRISRTTVINVFEILTSEGLIESRTGAGTFVSKVWMATRPPETEVVEPLDAAGCGRRGSVWPRSDQSPSGHFASRIARRL